MSEIRLENIRDKKLRFEVEEFLKLIEMVTEKITVYPRLFDYLREHLDYPSGVNEFYFNGKLVVKIRS